MADAICIAVKRGVLSTATGSTASSAASGSCRPGTVDAFTVGLGAYSSADVAAIPGAIADHF